MQSTLNSTLHTDSKSERVETLAAVNSGSNSRGALSHDAHNMVTALSLYCDLLEHPGVLASGYEHYGTELRLVADASRCLIEKLMASEETPAMNVADTAHSCDPAWSLLVSNPPSPEDAIVNFAAELEANRNLLDAIAGLGVAVSLRIQGGAVPVRLHGEDLTRILVNLVKNASEAMHGTGAIQIQLDELFAADATRWLVLNVEDCGPGIPARVREKIFDAGYSTHPMACGWTGPHRGLGLAICRALVESAGGRMRAVTRRAAGARFLIELPVLKEQTNK